MSESREEREARRKLEAKQAHDAYMKQMYGEFRSEIERREREAKAPRS